MGIMICAQHGKQGIRINIDKEIVKDIDFDKAIQEEDLIIVTVSFYDKTEFLYEERRLLKKDTFVRNKLKHSYIIREEEEEKELISLDALLTGICGKCYSEYMSKHNISIEF